LRKGNEERGVETATGTGTRLTVFSPAGGFARIGGERERRRPSDHLTKGKGKKRVATGWGPPSAEQIEEGGSRPDAKEIGKENP